MSPLQFLSRLRGLETVSHDTPLPCGPGKRPTYRWATGPITPVATPTDMIMIQGSATKDVAVKTVSIWGKSALAGAIGLQLIRRSTQFTTQGTATFTAVTPGKHDTQDPAATAVVSYIQVANLTTVGTANGVIDVGVLPFTNGGSIPNPGVVWDFCQSADGPVILRGTSDFLFIGGFGVDALPTTPQIYFSIEAEEYNG